MTPDDWGQPVRLVENCRDDRRACEITRPGSYPLEFGVQFLVYVTNLVASILGWLAACSLLFAFVGPTQVGKYFYRKRSATESDLVRVLEAHRAAPVAGTIPLGQGVLRLVLVEPDWVVDKSQEGVLATVSIGDLDCGEMPWGRHDVVVDAGEHQLRVFVPIKSGRQRRSFLTVRVLDRQVTGVVFEAPSIPELGGLISLVDRRIAPEPSLPRISLAVVAAGGLLYALARLL